MTDEEFEGLRRPYIELLEALQREYQKAAEPYIKRLIELETLRPRHLVIREEMLQFINAASETVSEVRHD